MAKIVGTPRVELHVTLQITEAEARALNALVGYGDDAFIAKFKAELGEHYIRDHEQGLREFFTSVRRIMPGLLEQTNSARRAFTGKSL